MLVDLPRRIERRLRAALEGDRAQPWMALLVVTRLVGVAVAVALLSIHDVSSNDLLLGTAGVVYAAVFLGVLLAWPAVARRPAVWVVDAVACLALVYASTDWRSPYYLFALTSLILPAVGLSPRRAIAWGVVWDLAYLGVALAQERLPTQTFESAIRIETLATHLLMPLLVLGLLAYAGEALQAFERERVRRERLAVQAERQRIAWELHDSAKQRVHAAHLLLSSVASREDDELVRLALAEVTAAASDMETSVAELREPIDDRPLEQLLRERAEQLAAATSSRIRVEGHAGVLPATTTAHAYRIAIEALTNAVRHAGARDIAISLLRTGDQVRIEVADDGVGLPELIRSGASGLRSMQHRAETIGAVLELDSAPGAGTRLTLVVPVSQDHPAPQEAHA